MEYFIPSFSTARSCLSESPGIRSAQSGQRILGKELSIFLGEQKMRTKKKMAALLLVMIGLTLICAGRSDADTFLNWDWDSCTLEGWEGASAETSVTVEEDGRNGTCGLGAEQQDHTANITVVKIGGQTLDPGALVGGEFGEDLPMTGEIYVDIDQQVPDVFSSYLELLILDEDSYARFGCYPHGGHGNIEELGDGWYRHYLVNSGHWEGSYPEDAGYFYLEWNWAEDVDESPLVFDNLMIAYEPLPIEVGVDIRPALCPNPLSLISKDVATSAEPCVCPSSFGPNGFTDLLLDFRTEDILEVLGAVEPNDVLELDFTGQLKDLTPIEGSDCVLIRDEML
jgi:hypothetical protein